MTSQVDGTVLDTPDSAPESRCPIDHTAFTSPTGCPVSPRAAAFDPFTGPYQVDPAASLRWSRDDEPVFYSPELDYWVVTRYEDVKAVFRDNELFSPAIALEKITPTSEEANAVLARYGYAMNRTLVNEDEPAHMPRRRALMEPFTPAALAHHEPMVRRLTREYVDRFIDTGHVDLVDEMLWEVPLTVALHFLGVPEEDMDTLREYSIAHTVNTWGRPAPEQQVAVADAVGKFWQFAGTVLEKMRKNPDGHGWTPFGIRVQQEQPDVVTDSYLHSMMMAGIVAAHETTANASANALRLLLEHREVWEDICADPSLIPNAVEECLRHSGSVAAWRRLVTADTTINGVAIPAGAKLLIVNSSANHDERHFDQADDFDIRRDNASDHLTFGYGSHQCMGKNLARMEIQVFLEELTRRLPHMELVPDQEFTYLPNTSFRGPDHVWVQWDPARNPERTDPTVLSQRQPVKIGEPSKNTIARTMAVTDLEPVADDTLLITLRDTSGRPLPKWSAGSHIDLDCGTVSRQYSLCGDPNDRTTFQIAVLHDHESRGGSRWIHTELAVGVRRCASTWNGLCDYLYQEDLIDANPVRAVKLPKRPAQTPKSLTVTQIADLLAAAGQFDEPPRSWPQLEQLIVHLGGITGARAAEMAGINVGDIRLSPDGPVLDLRGKGNQPRPVPFEPALLAHIEDYLISRAEVFPGSVPARRRAAARPLGFYKPTDPLLVGADGERITVPTMQYRLSRLFKRAGITPPRGALLHALRHTFATTLADAGADVYKLRDLLGHTSIATTQTYIKAAGQHNRDTAAANPLYDMIDDDDD